MKEIFNRGPIACNVDAVPILNYTGGIVTTKPVGGRASGVQGLGFQGLRDFGSERVWDCCFIYVYIYRHCFRIIRGLSV